MLYTVNVLVFVGSSFRGLCLKAFSRDQFFMVFSFLLFCY